MFKSYVMYASKCFSEMVLWYLIHVSLPHRKTQESLVVHNSDQKRKLDTERRKAQAAAEKAREMIKVYY